MEFIRESLRKSGSLASSLARESLAKRSKSPTLLSSLSNLRQSLERQDLTPVRAAHQIKNPFLAFNDATATKRIEMVPSSSDRVCITEFSTPGDLLGSPCCHQESGKHQATKRALDKAIKLATLLLDELALSDLKSSMVAAAHTSNSSFRSRPATPDARLAS